MPRKTVPPLPVLTVLFILLLVPRLSWGLASNNINLDSHIYTYLEKLSGFGLIDTDVHGIKPFTKAEAARLVIEAEGNISRLKPEEAGLATQIINFVKVLIPREVDLYNQEDSTPVVDFHPVSSARFRYVFLEGRSRNYTRLVSYEGRNGFFGLGHLEPGFPGGEVQTGGRESTPLLENNDGINYKEHNNFEFRTDSEFFFTRYLAGLVEPLVLVSGVGTDTFVRYMINKGYVKLGGHGLELEVGRDENWFGQGFRGTTILTDNARNLDEIKLSSPEPVDWPWFKRNIGLLKYALVFSRLSRSGEGDNLRQPWFVAAKLSVKPSPDFEVGVNFSRQQGGPNVIQPGLVKAIFSVGTTNNGSNTLAGIEMRWRLPWRWFRGTTVYWEYYGEDSYVVLPIVESHIAGIYIPRLTSDGRNDFRFEFFYGNPIAYTDYKYPEGYTNKNLIMGHSQGGDTKDYFGRFTHYFSERHTVALEYFHTQRGWIGRLAGQAVEEIDGGRIFWSLPLTDDWDVLLNYGYENIRNFNLTKNDNRQDHLVRLDISYRY